MPPLLRTQIRPLEAALERAARPVALVLERLVDALAAMTQPPRPSTRDTMLVAHLELQHLGRWVYLPGRPAKLGPRAAAEPSVVATGGRLVGIRPGTLGKSDQPGTRVLVLQQGTALAELSVSVADLVDVAPRDW